ncbi:MAG: phosphonate ABC transporter, permease protein PhnE [Devosia sp.]|jgi:phosphonate transport system permease protein|uniref:phosphonate ABC transporter, permease protein PhnE n=1 Tax=unclassified Devosia TaxID=196773 RepID=UPI0019EEA0F0|nr:MULTISPECIES: phosphonate ABC transporter, permease protein PhnE [unclassified Devosia]MBF0678691.1 phosphonate ABC transporter, permease protein PhnE [Devosia sp.]WEJ31740.1 phosphonate ABC transporter, permease protein PhnE [Devosia sp. SD17-2]
MTALSAAEKARLQAKFPSVFHQGVFKRFGLVMGLGAAVIYLVLCWFFFNVGPALQNGKWDRAAIYLQDWFSWRAQPRLRFGDDGSVTPQWSSRGQYAQGAEIDWLTPNADGSMRVSFDGETDRLHVTTTQVDVYYDGTLYPVVITADGAFAPENAPAAIQQDRQKVIVDYGFAGQAEIRGNQVYVQRRFFGWANFLYDPRSVLWGNDLVSTIGLIFSGDRVDPDRSNAALVLDEWLNNEVWQHGDILTKLMQTLVMAFVGTLLATAVAFPLAFFAARTITPNRATNWLMKRFFDFVRSVDMLIWALFFTRGFGPGPIPGIAAIFFTDTGALGKVYAEALENVDDKQREGMKSVGASPMAVNRFGVVPQVLPVFVSQSLYFWESNTRSATVIGAVGAGGIGLKLLESMGTNSDWDKVAYMVLLILLVVFLFDNLSNAIRSRLIGPNAH